MKGSLLQQLCQSRLNRKSVVVDIDLLIAYLIFIGTIILLVNFALRLTAPFESSINLIDKERNTITVQRMLNNIVKLSDFDELCVVNYVNLRLLSVGYEIKSFLMPYKDASFFNVSETNGSIVFKRDDNELSIIIGSSNSTNNINVNTIFMGNPSVFNKSLDANDFFSVDYDVFGNAKVIINSVVSDGDIDEVLIKPVNGLVSFTINGLSLDKAYIGDTPINYYCGVRGFKGSHTNFDRYGLLIDDRTQYYAKITGDIWWTD